MYITHVYIKTAQAPSRRFVEQEKMCSLWTVLSSALMIANLVMAAKAAT